MIGLVDGNNFFVSCERVFNRRLVGRPVAVLSNNDGCCVSRSNEFKALGIAMGTPYYQLRNREKSGELDFCSSNYELYGDMSRRIISILRDEALDVEQYSIDEAFIHPPVGEGIDLVEYGKRLRARILRWVGIPCGVGFAPTKTRSPTTSARSSLAASSCCRTTQRKSSTRFPPTRCGASGTASRRNSAPSRYSRRKTCATLQTPSSAPSAA